MLFVTVLIMLLWADCASVALILLEFLILLGFDGVFIVCGCICKVVRLVCL